jgi:hypothetical protein
MATDIDKLIVTNISALTTKYGAGVAQIQKAVKQLIDADKARGLTTIQVNLDDAAAMSKLKASPVTDPVDQKQNKAAIDAVFAALTPDYLMILGSIDVVPHQHLVNPAPDDGDEDVPADLPYACDAPYSTAIGDFTGPTRVVGRLPDVTEGSDPSYLVGLLGTAATYKSLARKDYASYLGISADTWHLSTASSLTAVFGTSTDMQVSPPDGPNGQWPPVLLARRAHFINCHGGPADFRFYGQPDNKDIYPVAHIATWLPGRITEGTVVAAECCYGAELYDPALAAGQMGICNTYLAEKAYGFFGSSNTAYGPDGEDPSLVNDSADLMCQYYWKHVLQGASSGRSALQARLDFVQARSPLDPYNMKTLGQYNLIGDPSIQMVAAPAAESTRAVRPLRRQRAKGMVVSAMTAGFDPWGLSRALRRSRLRQFGVAIGAAARVARPAKQTVPANLKRVFIQRGRQLGVEMAGYYSFSIEGAAVAKSRTSRKTKSTKRVTVPEAPVRFHVATAVLPHKNAPRPQVVVLIATEIQGSFVLRGLRSR